MKITQARFSDSILLFKEGFLKRWGLREYDNPEEPAVFVGLYSQTDIEAVKAHKGFALLWFTGADMPRARWLSPAPNIKVAVNEFVYKHQLGRYLPWQVEQFVEIPIKDYSDFTPCEPGDKIYCYQGSAAGGDKYGWNILKLLKERFGEDKFITGIQGYSIDYVKENYYKNSFFNLQFNVMAGFTTVLEMAHMGRPSLSNYPAAFCFGHFSLDDLVSEVGRILDGKITADPEEVAREARAFFVNNNPDWLDPKFWL